MGTLEGHTIAVTGAAQGIGLAIAECAAREGAAVVLSDLNAQALDDAIARLDAAGARAVAFVGDASTRANAHAIVGMAVDNFGGLDGLVCAGFRRKHGPAEDISDDDWCAMVEQGLTGHFRCAQEAARVMLKASGGSIVFITSIATRIAIPQTATYSAVKSGLVGLARQLGIEWARRGIRVNALAPGMTITPGMSPMAGAGRSIPVGEPCDPIDIAEMAVFLLSSRARHITGQEIVVDGGVSVGRGYYHD